jgi:hypothetical protein
VWNPAPGAHREQGVIRPQAEAGGPAWGVAQWYSRFTLAGTKLEPLESGSARFRDGAKAVTFGRAGSPEADLVMALNAREEYQGKAPEKGDPWPHLLVEQSLREHPRIARAARIPMGIEYKLLRAEPFHVAGWDERRHTAQFLLYITVQNGNRQSPGYADFFWFGVPMYDARYPLPRRHAAKDQSSEKKRGTGKFIFNPGGERYATKPAKEGGWVTIDTDLLPLIREGMESAWTAGFLAGSHELGDYQLGGINCGWEVTGPLDVAMQIRGLRLEAVLGIA